MNTLVAVAIVSIVLNPLLYRALPALRAVGVRGSRASGGCSMPLRGRPSGRTARRTTTGARLPTHRAVVIGYGPTGRTLTRLLRDNGIAPTVVELNMDTVRRLREEGVDAVYGDASHRDVLEAAGVAGVASLIITADVPNIREVIRLARELNPKLRVLARTAYLRDVDALHEAGANEVFSGEGEVALALTEAILSGWARRPSRWTANASARTTSCLAPSVPNL